MGIQGSLTLQGLPRLHGLAATALTLVLVASCGDAEFQKRYAEVKAAGAKGLALGDLLALDQRYPDRLELKVDLGAASLAAGAFDQAFAYLSRGEALAASSSDSRLKTVLWADLAQYFLATGDLDRSLGYADRALQDRDEALGVIFTRAKARLAKGDQAAALADFQTGWDSRRGTMVAQDYREYTNVLVAVQNWDRALAVAEASRLAVPYEPGLGLVESLCYENLGRADEAIVAALVDVVYLESMGALTRAQILENLGRLRARFQGRAGESSALATLGAAEAWLVNDWDRVSFDDGLVARSPDARFFQLSAGLEAGHPADLKAYADLEGRFRGFASYYLSLLRYLRDVVHDPRNDGVAALAEKVVDLAPRGPWAGEGRRFLALGYGLPADAAPKLLTKNEVDLAVAQGNLAAVTRLLETPDNPSTQRAVERLSLWARDPARGPGFEAAYAGAVGRAKERWNLVLQSR